jgi:hypothetical protein
MIGYFSVYGNSFGPTGWGVASSHYIAGEKFDACKEATHSTHMIVSVSSYLVMKVP